MASLFELNVQKAPIKPIVLRKVRRGEILEGKTYKLKSIIKVKMGLRGPTTILKEHPTGAEVGARKK
ncbi:MAG TPA: hypothetical protein ENH87_16500 [Pricia antarctica]|uniref:Uncharacterized protein n=2 Tax=root TaxID=1 RepID=A0A831VSW0_9FLAO|nr:hypothetical protein [Pricia antarctica]